MGKFARLNRLAVLRLCCLAAATPAYGAEPANRVDAPSLATPQRGHIAGSMAQFGVRGADLARGALSIPLTIDVPDARGALPNVLFPAYSQDAGVGPWGMGWAASFSIRRFAHVGHVDYVRDTLMSPWGELAQGTDGYWYPHASGFTVRLQQVNDTWKATDVDGTVWTFGDAASREVTARGTYAWHLCNMASVQGERVTLHYTANDTGRLFVDHITWGRAPALDVYALHLVYEPLPDGFRFASYRSGQRTEMDRRVTRVAVCARAGTAEAFVERWHYALTYTQDTHGPAFYLATAGKIFASGAQEPATRFDYHPTDTALHAEHPVELAGFDAVFAPRKDESKGFVDGTLTFFDDDEDGQVEFEHSGAYSRFYRQGNAWHREAASKVASADFQLEPACRPEPGTDHEPRALAKFHPTDSHSLVYVTGGSTPDAALTLCHRDGQRVRKPVIFPPHNHLDEATTMLVDLDGDQRPDFVAIAGGQINVYRNVSDADQYAFEAQPSQYLEPAIHADAVYYHDINGDGIPDLIQQENGVLTVWYGRGDLSFDPQGHDYPVQEPDGQALSLMGYSLHFFDANRDGLTDILVSSTYGSTLYLNRGTHFQRADVPALGRIPSLRHGPMTVDLSGSGEAEVAYSDYARDKLYAVRFTRPESGLLKSIDDGRGNIVALSYTRAATQPGARVRHAVLAAACVSHAGQGEDCVNFAFGPPTLHSRSHALRGFDTVTTRAADAETYTRLYNDDGVAGQVRGVTQYDLVAGVLSYEETTAREPFHYQGVPAWRQKGGTRGWHDSRSNQSIMVDTHIESFESGFCPALSRQVAGDAQIITRQSYADVASLRGLPHCLVAAVETFYKHADRKMDFEVTQTVERNAEGRIARVFFGRGTARRLLQEVSYDAQQRPVQVCQPGDGCTSAIYDATTGRMVTVQSPDGIVTRATYDAQTEQPLQLTRQRAGDTFSEHFAYDDHERLQAVWDSLSATSAAHPREHITYTFGDRHRPGLVESRTAVDAVARVHRRVAALQDGSGDAIASAMQTDAGWVLPTVRTYDAALRRRQVWLPNHALESLSEAEHTTLRADGKLQATVLADGFAEDVESSTRTRADVWRKQTSKRSIADGQLWHHDAVNKRAPYATATGPWGTRDKHIASTGDATTYVHDAGGRLRRVVLADGAVMRARYDAQDRITEVTRTGVGRITHAYDKITGKLVLTSWYDTRNKPVRTAKFDYDGIGRVTAATYATAGWSRETAVYRYLYDGAHAGGAHTPAQQGFLSGVAGPGFAKSFTYQADGKPLTTTMTWHDWRTLTQRWTYFDDGSARATTVTLADAVTGATLSTRTTATQLDAFGRVAGATLEGQPFYTLHYDTRNRLAQVELAGGTTVERTFDPSTSHTNGTRVEAPEWAADFAWDLDRDGHVGAESATLDGTRHTRTYDYDDRGFLVAERAAASAKTYAYGPQGVRQGRPPARDTSGRATHAHGHALSYGANGDIAHFKAGRATIAYLYDEAGQRIARLKNGHIEHGFFSDAVVTGSEVVSPVHAGAQLAGFLVGTQFTPVLADPRASIVADAGRRTAWPSAYGERENHPQLAYAMDYAGSRYDAELGWVRMAVRDYDPAQGAFTTPDATFLRDPALCVASPVECNLYTYAKNNPTAHVDPDGEIAHVVIGAAIGTGVGLGTEAILQVYRGEFNARGLIGAAAGGAVSGAVAAATGGASLIASVGSAAASNVAGGVVTRAITGAGTTARDIVWDAGVGVVTGGLAHHFAPPAAVKPAPSAKAAPAARASGQWQVGDDIYKLTQAGKEPSWSTVRARFWKNEANSPQWAQKYDLAENHQRMSQGLAPRQFNAKKGGLESLELSHEPIPMRDGGRNVVPRWPQDHARVDPYRRPGY